jgi:hypothetical protein
MHESVFRRRSHRLASRGSSSRSTFRRPTWQAIVHPFDAWGRNQARRTVFVMLNRRCNCGPLEFAVLAFGLRRQETQEGAITKVF